MKKKSNKKKKYAVGGKVNSYIETPSDMLAENQIMMAQAELDAATNPLIQSLQGLSALLGTAGNSFMSMGNQNKGDSTVVEEMKFGGSVPINAEKGEVIQTDNEIFELGGKTHAQGGEDINLPPGSFVFSEELKIGGKSLAEIKKKKVKDIEKYSKDTDGLSKNSKERAIKADQVFDKMAQTISSIAQILEKQEELEGVRKKYKVGGLLPNKIEDKNLSVEEDLLQKELYPSLDINNYFSDILTPSQAHTPGALDMKQRSTQQITYEQQMQGLKDKGPDAINNKIPGIGLTPGDMLGAAGNLYQGISPYLNTLRSRATDKPNVNAFAGFGEDGLKANEDALGQAQSILDNYLQDAELGATGAKKSSRSSARGVNTMRALDIATEGNKQKAVRAAYTDYANRVMTNLAQKSQLENQQDQMVMSGEDAKNLANIQDKDNYLANIGQDKATIGKSVSQFGKFLNQSKERDVMASLMNIMFEHTGMDFGSMELRGKDTEQTMKAKHDLEIDEVAKKAWKTATDNPNSKDGKYKSLAEYKKVKGIV